jgi:DNA-3-methyladenine glycosylase II
MRSDILTRQTLKQALLQLSTQDRVMKELLQTYGVPPLWQRRQDFQTLMHIVLEQKVSLASAAAVLARVQALCPSMTPVEFLRVSEKSMRDAGISERKLSYCQSIAQALLDDRLDLIRLRKLDDEAVIDALVEIRGIGPWTAGVYLLMAMRRADAWASGDRALAVSAMECYALSDVPDYASLDAMAARWSPCRGAAARMLWHAYRRRSEQAKVF